MHILTGKLHRNYCG